VDVSSGVFYRSFHRIASIRQHGRRTAMKGYVITKRGRYYAVIYEGLDPVTGQERRTWHPAGTHRAEADHHPECEVPVPVRRSGSGWSATVGVGF
jgi:hypothetical protein